MKYSDLTPTEQAEARALRDQLLMDRDPVASPMGEGCGQQALDTVRALLAFAEAWDQHAAAMRDLVLTRRAA